MMHIVLCKKGLQIWHNYISKANLILIRLDYQDWATESLGFAITNAHKSLISDHNEMLMIYWTDL